MALIPFNRQDRLAHKPMTNMLDDFLGDMWRPILSRPGETFKVDVREEILHYLVEADMPGVQKQDISVEFHDGCLIIAVNHKQESDAERGNYVHKERHYTSMQRSIYLAGATGLGITAALSDGVLHIHVPKEDDTAKSVKVEIQ